MITAVNPPILVAGMHRSGTSLVVRVLQLCGLDLGPEDRLLPPGDGNPNGFWENREMDAITEDVLAHLSGGWNFLVPDAEAGWAEDAALEPLKTRARELTDQLSNSKPWGWKDPRATLAIPFWKSLIPDLKVVVVLRHPVEVALSLMKRVGCTESFAYAMWLDYNRRILTDTAPGERIVTHYDSYFLNGGHELRRLVQWTGLSPDEAAVKAAKDAISASTRQQQLSGEGDQAVVPAEVADLYKQLCRMAGDDLQQALNAGTLAPPQAAEPGPALPGQPVVPALREQARRVFDQAQEKIEEEDTTAALALLVEAVTLDPHRGPGHNDLGVLLMQAGEPRLALDYLKMAASLNPGDNSTTTNLAAAYIALGRNEDAIKSYLALLENSPDDMQALDWLASIAREVKNPAKAREYAERLLALQPDHTGARKVLTALNQPER